MKPASPGPWKVGTINWLSGTPILDPKNGTNSPVAMCANPDDAAAIVKAMNTIYWSKRKKTNE